MQYLSTCTSLILPRPLTSQVAACAAAQHVHQELRTQLDGLMLLAGAVALLWLVCITCLPHCPCMLQVMMVSEPKMVTQVLDRQMYPDSIDKAPLYNMMDQASTAHSSCP